MPRTTFSRRHLAVAGIATLLTGAGVALVVTGTDAADDPAAWRAGASPSAQAASSTDGPGSTAPGPKAGGPAATPGRPSQAGRPTPKAAAAQAKALVVADRALVRGVAAEDYRSRAALVEKDGSRHVRFDRTYRGLEVLGGDFIVHTGPDGQLRDTTLTQSAPISVSTTPQVTKADAARTAEAKFAGTDARATATLVVDAGDGAPRLAWRVLVEGKGASAMTVVVDAQTGDVRRAHDNVHTEAGTGHGRFSGKVPLSTTRRADGTYELIDPERGGSETRDAHGSPIVLPFPTKKTSAAITDDDNVWGDSATHPTATAVDLHYGIQQTWDYFKQVHGRNGIRDDGKGVTAYLVGDYDNASWNDDCQCMKFEAGDAEVAARTTLDTVAHEMAHGITTATADLTYSGESGSLNEATSDIFGALVEFHADNPADPPDYLKSEQRNPDKPLRYMDDPAKDGKSLSCWTPKLKGLDVHYGSGVGNKFFYTLAVGSGKSKWGDSPTCGGAPAVTGIGNDKAGQIWYRALTRYMVSYTNYSAAREATLKAAADLYGADSDERKTVDAAWKAVGVDGTDPVAPDPGPTPSPPGPSQKPVFERIRSLYTVVGKPISLTVKAYDPQDDPVTYSITNLPAGLTLDPATGSIWGVLTEPTTAHPRITATDPAGNSATTSFSVLALPPLAVNNPGSWTGVVGIKQNLRITSTHKYVEYTVTGLPAGMEHIYDGLISGAPTAAGDHTVVVTATDPAGQRATTTFEWRVYAKVSDIPRPPRPSTSPSASPSASASPSSGSSPTPARPSPSGSTPGRPTEAPTSEPAPSAPPAEASGPLALTGTNVAGLAGIGVLMIVAGALLTLRRRRRPGPPVS